MNTIFIIFIIFSYSQTKDIKNGRSIIENRNSIIEKILSSAFLENLLLYIIGDFRISVDFVDGYKGKNIFGSSNFLFERMIELEPTKEQDSKVGNAHGKHERKYNGIIIRHQLIQAIPDHQSQLPPMLLQQVLYFP
jgi:hypothetical protein